MLRLNVQRIIAMNGLENPSIYLQYLGLSRSVTQRLLTNNIKGFPPKVVEKLCLIFHCTPNDLIEWIPDKPEQTNEPLKALIRAEKIDLRYSILGVPLEKLGELAKVIEEYKKESGR